MKVKNLWVALIQKDKVIIVKECSNFKKLIRILVDAPNDEYKSVFTNKSFWYKRQSIMPLECFLDTKDLKPNISKKRLIKIYESEEKQKEMKKALKIDEQKIGFE